MSGSGYVGRQDPCGVCQSAWKYPGSERRSTQDITSLASISRDELGQYYAFCMHGKRNSFLTTPRVREFLAFPEFSNKTRKEKSILCRHEFARSIVTCFLNCLALSYFVFPETIGVHNTICQSSACYQAHAEKLAAFSHSYGAGLSHTIAETVQSTQYTQAFGPLQLTETARLTSYKRYSRIYREKSCQRMRKKSVF